MYMLGWSPILCCSLFNAFAMIMIAQHCLYHMYIDGQTHLL